MSTTPGPEHLATADVLQRIDALLSLIDHPGRRCLDADARLALVTAAIRVARRVEALRAVLVGEAERAKAAESARGTSLRSVLGATAHLTPGEAGSLVYAGRDLTNQSSVRAAALAGDVSVSQARAIDSVLGELPASLTAEQRGQAESMLLQQASRLDAKALAQQTRHVLESVAPEVDAVEDELARLDAQRKQAVAARSFTMLPDGRGSVLLRGQLPLVEAAPLQQWVAAYQASAKASRRKAADRLDPISPEVTPEQARADALVALVAAHESALTGARRLDSSARSVSTEAGDGARDSAQTVPVRYQNHDGSGCAPVAAELIPLTNGAEAPRDTAIPEAIPLKNGTETAPFPVEDGTGHEASGLRIPLLGGQRPRLVVTMSLDDLTRRLEQAGHLIDGSAVTAGELRRLACDASVIPVVLGGASEILDAGREQRLVTPEIRRALALRDQGCAFPGCATPEYACEAHHIVPWWAHGPTALSNLVLLCPHHHGTVEPLRLWQPPANNRWRVRMAPDGLPEFLPPSRLGRPTPEPMRHQRFQQCDPAQRRPRSAEHTAAGQSQPERILAGALSGGPSTSGTASVPPVSRSSPDR